MIPPLIGFFAKQQVLLASLQLDYYFVTFIAIFTSVLGAAYYLRIVKYLFFYDDAFLPYLLKRKSGKNSEKEQRPKLKFILNSTKKEHKLAILPNDNLNLIIAILTN